MVNELVSEVSQSGLTHEMVLRFVLVVGLEFVVDGSLSMEDLIVREWGLALEERDVVVCLWVWGVRREKAERESEEGIVEGKKDTGFMGSS